MSVEVFISYHEADDSARRALETHLSNLERNGLVRIWSARHVSPGQDRRAVIEGHLERARLILLLISPDYFASNECHDVEMKRAIERYRAGSAHVVPIIIRYVHWRGAPFDGLSVLPDSSRPVDSPAWGTADKAWTNVVGHLSALVEEMLGRRPSGASPAGKSFVEAHGGRFSTPGSQPAPPVAPNSSRAPFSANHSSWRLTTASQPEIASPVSAPRPSQQTAPRTAAPLTARSPTARGQSRLLVFAALGVAAVGVSVGAWELSRPVGPNVLHSEGPIAPTAMGTSVPMPVGSPAPVANPLGLTAPTGTGPCCGGSACAPALQDTRGSICDTRTPDHCATCSSGRARVDRACGEALDPAGRFFLRLANVAFKARNPAFPKLCVHIEGEPIASRQCTAVSDGSDVPDRLLYAAESTRLPVSIADLIDSGRGLTIDVEDTSGRVYTLRRATTVKGPLLRSALCRGVTFNVEGPAVSFYLDDF